MTGTDILLSRFPKLKVISHSWPPRRENSQRLLAHRRKYVIVHDAAISPLALQLIIAEQCLRGKLAKECR